MWSARSRLMAGHELHYGKSIRNNRWIQSSSSRTAAADHADEDISQT